MRPSVRRKLVLGVAGIAVLGGAAGAVAATQSSGSSSRQAFLDDVAKRLNVTPGALGAAVKGADIERIEAAVAAGRLSSSQAGALKQRLEGGGTPPFFGAGGFGGGRGGPGLGGFAGAAAKYLGLDPATLRADRTSGKSLAQIAAATPGKSVEGLKAAIMAAAKERLAGAVSSGRITAKQEQERLSALSSRIEAIIQRTTVTPPNGAPGPGSHGPW